MRNRIKSNLKDRAHPTSEIGRKIPCKNLPFDDPNDDIRDVEKSVFINLCLQRKNWERIAIFLQEMPSLTLIPHLMTNHLSQLLNGYFDRSSPGDMLL